MDLSGYGLCPQGTTMNITRVYWSTDSETSMQKCCEKYANGFDFSYWMCMSICQLCCKKLIIEWECLGDQPPTDRTRNNTDPRDYPTSSVSDRGGVSFTASKYGADLPIVFGSDKLPGNVFWASPIRTVSLPDNEFYTSIDFAVGICEGEINGMLRMWLGEKLIIDNSANVDVNGIMQANEDGFIAGRQIDFTDPNGPLRNVTAAQRTTKITVMNGSENQLPEGIMAQREGFDNCPGYRGVAYVLFENFIVAQSAIPVLFVEITSNTESGFPRLFGNNATPEVFFDRPDGEMLIVDPSYDLLHVSSIDSNGSATPADGVGIATFDYNTIDLIDEVEIDETEVAPQVYDVTRLLPMSGFLMLHETVGNAGTLRTWNPFTGTFMDTLGPGGSISGHNLLTGLAALERGSLSFVGFDPVTGAPTDVFMGVGSVNESVGFVTVNASGQMSFVSTLNGVLTKNRTRSAYMNVSPAFATATPTFFDGGASIGQHAILVEGDSNDTTSFIISRITVNSPTVSLSAPVFTTITTLSTASLMGLGKQHTIQLVMIDPADNGIIMFFTTNTTEGSIAAKLNPFTGAIVWLTTAPDFLDGMGADRAYTTNRTYAWIGVGGVAVYRLNFADGSVETLADAVTEVGLPVPLGQSQFYNSIENSITYVSNTTNQRVVKTYLERITRSTVELSDIVRLLLERVGLLNTDMNTQDLAALTLFGYTIHRRQSLRTSFSELAQAFKYDVIESNGRIKYKARGDASTITVNHKYAADVEESGWMRSKDTNDIARIRKINLTYRDIDREYRDNVQSIILPKYSSQSFDNDGAIDVNVPIVLDANSAKQLAEILLYAKLTYDTTFDMTLAPRFMNVDPGDVLTVVDENANETTLRVRRTTIGADRTIAIEASKEDSDIYNDVVNLFGNIGRYEASVFAPLPPRVDVLLMDIPFLNDTQAAETTTEYFVWTVFLNNKASASIPSDIGVSVNATQSYVIPRPLHFPTWGYVTEPPIFTTARFSTDNVSQMRVKIRNQTGAVLGSATHAALLADNQCNLCYVGRELLQFTNATHEGDDVWLFTGLHRGKFGTDMAVGTQTVGDKFVLLAGVDAILDNGSITRINIPAEEPKNVVQYNLRSPNPLQPSPVAFHYARNLLPWAVADLKFYYSGNDAVASWQRRTRYGGEWLDDGSDQVPINETDESYVAYLHTDLNAFSVSEPTTYLRRVELTTNSLTYLQADQIADGFDNTVSTLFITVYQNGSVENYRAGSAKSQYLDPL